MCCTTTGNHGKTGSPAMALPKIIRHGAVCQTVCTLLLLLTMTLLPALARMLVMMGLVIRQNKDFLQAALAIFRRSSVPALLTVSTPTLPGMTTTVSEVLI